MSIIVILGAGASYDSVLTGALPGNYETSSWRPPLVKDLFGTREVMGKATNMYPAVRALINEMRLVDLETENLEDRLGEWTIRSETDSRSYAQLMSLRFYLRDVLYNCGENWFKAVYGVTNYHSLVERVRRWTDANATTATYVSFNYDTLLEKALGDVLDFHPNSVPAYARRDIAVVKPHGSVNWNYRVDSLATGEHEVVKALKVRPELLTEDALQMGTGGRENPINAALIPALAIPASNKDSFICPRAHVDLLTKRLKEASHVLVIGWRATEKNFVDLYRANVNSQVKVLYACAGSAMESHENLNGPLRDDVKDSLIRNSEFSESRTFTGLLDGPSLNNFLK